MHVNEAIKEKILSIVPSATMDEGGEWTQFKIAADQWKSLAMKLKGEELLFDYLFCLTCIDWKTHLTMVYHLTSTITRNNIVIKADLMDRKNACIDSVVSIWKTAEFHEREVFDLFGVKFIGHPDLRRLFLTDEWKGYPLLKDYEDPVNMIKL